jgi:hypothetical protein
MSARRNASLAAGSNKSGKALKVFGNDSLLQRCDGAPNRIWPRERRDGPNELSDITMKQLTRQPLDRPIDPAHVFPAAATQPWVRRWRSLSGEVVQPVGRYQPIDRYALRVYNH